MFFASKKARRKNDRPLYDECLLSGTRLSSHDFSNLERCHHQKLAICFILVFDAFVLIRWQKYDYSFNLPNFSAAFC